MRSLSQYVKELFVSKLTNGDVRGFEPLNRLYGYIFYLPSFQISIQLLLRRTLVLSAQYRAKH